ncbi:hypothetical protein SteCoe_18268 [Stentor coeruleus]|uniref:Uncharacterized protein n=1 Tax=Stentor coeruleus TaxID=5963 RepID=A0A1R2BWZ9_9CILI|nr:hypothetical protein SteCoe_18268 [Stentor coeruleus]
MENHRLNLQLPLSSKKLTERLYSERPTTRTANLNEGSFSCEVPREGSSPKMTSSSSFKTLTSVGKLKEIMQKTSQKLKNISKNAPENYSKSSIKINQTKNESSRLSQYENTEKHTEITKLRREICILEMEKKELEITNKKLHEQLLNYQESFKADNNNELQRYSKFMLSSIKDNSKVQSEFNNIFISEEAFILKMNQNTENLSFIALGLMKFVLGILEKYNIGAITDLYNKNYQNLSQNCDKINLKEEAYMKIYKETQHITDTISEQKKKLERIYENVKETVKITRSVSPVFSRPQSSASSAYYEHQKEANFLPLFPKKK